MNLCKSKPQDLPYAIKVRKLWEGNFYLSPWDLEELIQRVELYECQHNDAVDFIDERGEWL